MSLAHHSWDDPRLEINHAKYGTRHEDGGFWVIWYYVIIMLQLNVFGISCFFFKIILYPQGVYTQHSWDDPIVEINHAKYGTGLEDGGFWVIWYYVIIMLQLNVFGISCLKYILLLS